MKFIKKLFFCTLFSAAAWLGIYTYIHATDGFSLHQITISHTLFPQAEPMSSTSYDALFDQTFRYIGKGCQFYVFESEDGKYVIKFLKYKHLRPCTWMRRIPKPSSLHKIVEAKIARREERISNLWSSCQLCFDKLADESGILLLHFDRTPHFQKKVRLIDKVGFTHLVDLDTHEFILQRKALSVEAAFQNASEEEIALRVQQLASVVLERCQKGIRDRDRAFVQNVAFAVDEPKAIFIDIGQFYEDESILSQEEQQVDLKRRMGNLRHWTERYYPQLLPCVEAQISALFACPIQTSVFNN